jgi:3-oxoacyl-[acyl-carrier protein] reductase
VTREGGKVSLVARNENQLRDVARFAEGETLIASADVVSEEDVREVVSRTIDEYGKIDVLINNAAIGQRSLYGEGNRINEISYADWRQILNVNLNGVFLFTRQVLPTMIESGRGNIINISSGAGKTGIPTWTPYVTSKWGLEGFTRSVAHEYIERGINVNSLYPGGRVNTGFWRHLPDQKRKDLLPPTVLNDAAVLLARQGKDGVTGKSMTAKDWENYLE